MLFIIRLLLQQVQTVALAVDCIVARGVDEPATYPNLARALTPHNFALDFEECANAYRLFQRYIHLRSEARPCLERATLAETAPTNDVVHERSQRSE